MTDFIRYIGKLRLKKNEDVSSERESDEYGIFRGVYFGEYETKNYKYGIVHLAMTPAFFYVLITIDFIQYSRQKSHLKILFLHRAPVSYYCSLIHYCFQVM